MGTTRPCMCIYVWISRCTATAKPRKSRSPTRACQDRCAPNRKTKSIQLLGRPRARFWACLPLSIGVRLSKAVVKLHAAAWNDPPKRLQHKEVWLHARTKKGLGSAVKMSAAVPFARSVGAHLNLITLVRMTGMSGHATVTKTSIRGADPVTVAAKRLELASRDYVLSFSAI